jgi:hypothetical protein
MFLTFSFFFYVFSRLSKDQSQCIWNAKRQSIFRDFFFGSLIWLIGFPISSFTYELAEVVNVFWFGVEGPQQSVISSFKQSIDHPFLLIIAIFSVTVGSPIIEEISFRGFLHSFLRSKVGTKATILLSSFIFASFHFSATQNIGNFPLLLSLFTLAIFLGFLYERQKSLWAPIGLHMTFNMVSVIRIIFEF